MGDVNQRIFLERLVPRVDGPVLEIGSKDYGSTVSFRDLYRDSEYVGADLEAGKGVDVVADLSAGRVPCRRCFLQWNGPMRPTPPPWTASTSS